MKIAINLFEVRKIGGIWTFQKNLVEGLRKLGHQVDEYYILSNKKYLENKKKIERGEFQEDVSLNRLGFMTDEMQKQYKQVMQNYDAIIFTHPCPHLNKSFSSKNWTSCYDLDKPIITIFHDTCAEPYYHWIKEVSNKITVAVAVQPKAFISIDYAKIKNYTMIYHPFNLEDMYTDFTSREKWIISPHQFKSWKRLDIIINAFIGLQNWQLHMFSYGSLQAYWKYEDFWKKAVENGLVYHGVTPSAEIIETFKKSQVIVDLSYGEFGRHYAKQYPKMTNINYALLEGIKYGVLPFVSKHAIQHPFTSENFIVIPESDNLHMIKTLRDTLQNINYEDYIDMLKTNQQILKENYDNVKIAKKYENLLLGKYDVVDYNKLLGKKQAKTLLMLYQ